MTKPLLEAHPVLLVRVSPVVRADRRRLEEVLHELARTDPTITVEAASEENELVIGSMSELHLEAVCRDLVQHHSIQINKTMRSTYESSIPTSNSQSPNGGGTAKLRRGKNAGNFR